MKIKIEKMRKHNYSCVIIWDQYVQLIQKKLVSKNIVSTTEEIRQALTQDFRGSLVTDLRLRNAFSEIFEENRVSVNQVSSSFSGGTSSNVNAF